MPPSKISFSIQVLQHLLCGNVITTNWLKSWCSLKLRTGINMNQVKKQKPLTVRLKPLLVVAESRGCQNTKVQLSSHQNIMDRSERHTQEDLKDVENSMHNNSSQSQGYAAGASGRASSIITKNSGGLTENSCDV